MDLSEELARRNARVRDLEHQERQRRERRRYDIEAAFWRGVDAVIADDWGTAEQLEQRVYDDALRDSAEDQAARDADAAGEWRDLWDGLLDPPERESSTVEVIHRRDGMRDIETRDSPMPHYRVCTKCGRDDWYGGNKYCSNCGHKTEPAESS